MLFFSCFTPIQPLGKAFTIYMSLQTRSTSILNQHVLPALNQSSPAYKFNTGSV